MSGSVSGCEWPRSVRSGTAPVAARRPRGSAGAPLRSSARLCRALAAALVALALLAGFGPVPALAQFQRNLPANGVLAVMRADAGLPLPLVSLDNRIFRLAPGGIVVDQNNRTLLHGQLPPQAAAYVVFDSNGDILRMFLLTAEELKRLRAR